MTGFIALHPMVPPRPPQMMLRARFLKPQTQIQAGAGGCADGIDGGGAPPPNPQADAVGCADEILPGGRGWLTADGLNAACGTPVSVCALPVLSAAFFSFLFFKISRLFLICFPLSLGNPN